MNTQITTYVINDKTIRLRLRPGAHSGTYVGLAVNHHALCEAHPRRVALEPELLGGTE